MTLRFHVTFIRETSELMFARDVTTSCSHVSGVIVVDARGGLVGSSVSLWGLLGSCWGLLEAFIDFWALLGLSWSFWDNLGLLPRNRVGHLVAKRHASGPHWSRFPMHSALRRAPWEFSFVVGNVDPCVEYGPFPPGRVSHFTIADPIAQIHQLDVPRDARRNIVR